MLILSRKVNQVINIGDDIQITVTNISGNKVRLGIVAPKDKPIVRKEIQGTLKGFINEYKNRNRMQ